MSGREMPLMNRDTAKKFKYEIDISDVKEYLGIVTEASELEKSDKGFKVYFELFDAKTGEPMKNMKNIGEPVSVPMLVWWGDAARLEELQDALFPERDEISDGGVVSVTFDDMVRRWAYVTVDEEVMREKPDKSGYWPQSLEIKHLDRIPSKCNAALKVALARRVGDEEMPVLQGVKEARESKAKENKSKSPFG